MIMGALVFAAATLLVPVERQKASGPFSLEEMHRLVGQLGAEQEQRRQAARKTLLDVGWRYPKQVAKVLQKQFEEAEDIEVQIQLEQLLYQLKIGRWVPLPEAPLSGRFHHTLTWVGDRTIVWGGMEGRELSSIQKQRYFNDGAVYEVQLKKWSPMSPSPLKARRWHRAVWTGSRLLIWGGMGRGPVKNYLGREVTGKIYFDDGASYDPVADQWEKLPASPLAPRVGHTAVWTGTHMLVWGGEMRGKKPTFDGASYNPETNKWEVLPDAPVFGRSHHSAVWTGKQMMVWGGYPFHQDGAAYDPHMKRWSELPPAPLEARQFHASVWTGSEMIVWGGISMETLNASSARRMKIFGDGASYNPSTRIWKRLPNPSLEPRYGATMLWTGREAIVWGGRSLVGGIPSFVFFPDGALYNPTTRKWRGIPDPSPAEPLVKGVWADDRAIFWGVRIKSGRAQNSSSSFPRGGMFIPAPR